VSSSSSPTILGHSVTVGNAALTLHDL